MKHKSSSSSSHKRDKSSSTKTGGDIPKTKSQIDSNADSDDGIDCGSGMITFLYIITIYIYMIKWLFYGYSCQIH